MKKHIVLIALALLFGFFMQVGNHDALNAMPMFILLVYAIAAAIIMLVMPQLMSAIVRPALDAVTHFSDAWFVVGFLLVMAGAGFLLFVGV